MNRIVAVTAAAGFIGSAVVRDLVASGVEVVALDRDDRWSRADLPDGVRRATYDLGSGTSVATALAGADAVVHLAHRGLPSPPGSPGAREELTANVRGALDLLEDCGSAGVARLVVASSGGTVYGAPASLPVAESAALAPMSPYGLAKVAVERCVDVFGQSTGLGAVSLRIGNAVGAGQLRGAGVGAPARFLSLAAAGRPLVVWGDGAVVRDYVWIDDIVSAVRAALAPTTPAGAYNVGTGVGTSLHDLVDAVAAVSGRDLEVVREPGRSFDVPSIVLDPGLLSRTTGWRPRTTLRRQLELVWQALSA